MHLALQITLSLFTFQSWHSQLLLALPAISQPLLDLEERLPHQYQLLQTHKSFVMIFLIGTNTDSSLIANCICYRMSTHLHLGIIIEALFSFVEICFHPRQGICNDLIFAWQYGHILDQTLWVRVSIVRCSYSFGLPYTMFIWSVCTTRSCSNNMFLNSLSVSTIDNNSCSPVV